MVSFREYTKDRILGESMIRRFEALVDWCEAELSGLKPSAFTDEEAGIIQGKISEGFVQAMEGFGYVNGWDELKANVEALNKELPTEIAVLFDATTHALTVNYTCEDGTVISSDPVTIPIPDVSGYATKDALSEEVTARASADSSLQTGIEAEASTRADADATLQANIDAEATARKEADSAIEAKIPAEYTLPPATASTIGGVKPGNNLTVEADGTLNATGTAYDLPKATASTLGGVIVGDNVAVDANGKISVDFSGLQIQIDANSNAVNSEASARSEADSTLQANIDAEAAARSEADSTLQADIDTQSARITNLTTKHNEDYNTLGKAIQANAEAIETEASARQTADEALEAKIPSEYTLPIATSSVLGGIKVGTGLSINSSTGVLTPRAGTTSLTGILQLASSLSTSDTSKALTPSLGYKKILAKLDSYATASSPSATGSRVSFRIPTSNSSYDIQIETGYTTVPSVSGWKTQTVSFTNSYSMPPMVFISDVAIEKTAESNGLARVQYNAIYSSYFTLESYDYNQGAVVNWLAIGLTRHSD